jgi:hyperosmotically inducible protein
MARDQPKSRRLTMKTALPFTFVVVTVAVIGCSREDTSREAREAAAEVRTVAARAGERLADSWLTAKVQARFFADDDIKARYIDVSSRDGTVTLKGFVESDAVRSEAVRIARNIDGVTHVDDQLLLGQAPQTAVNAPPPPAVGTSGSSGASPAGRPAALPDDAMVTSLIQSRYFLDPSIKMRNIEVSAINGVVTLRGTVAGNNERAQALLLARTTEGVERVEDGLTIDASLGVPGPAAGGTAAAAPLPSAPIAGADAAAPATTATPSSRASTAVGTSGARPADSSLEKNLRSKLAADPQTKGVSLDISARDGVVLLQGTVATAAIKQKAISVARQGEGVVQVVDRITVKK